MKSNKRKVNVEDLESGMVLGEPFFDLDGKTLFSEGLKLNDKRIERIVLLNAKSIFIQEIKQFLDYEIKKSTTGQLTEDKISINKQRILDQARNDAFKMANEIIDEVIDTRSVKLEKVTKIVENILRSILDNSTVVLNLASLSSVNDYVFNHSINVCVLSIITGIFLGFNQDRLINLGSGALVHDIGKMLVPQEVLNKPGELTKEEFKIIQQHTIYGHKILKDTMNWSEEVSSIALSHHERIDGNGYPFQLKNDQISVFAKIVSVTDVFDAMTSDRVYCDKVDYYKAIEYLLKNTRTQFDEDIVKKFVSIIGYYPLGLRVRLTTGDVGVVTSKDCLYPLIKILVDSNGNILQSYYEIDLNKNPKILITDIE